MQKFLDHSRKNSKFSFFKKIKIFSYFFENFEIFFQIGITKMETQLSMIIRFQIKGQVFSNLRFFIT